MKNKKSMLADDKTRIGYSEGEEISSDPNVFVEKYVANLTEKVAENQDNFDVKEIGHTLGMIGSNGFLSRAETETLIRSGVAQYNEGIKDQVSDIVSPTVTITEDNINTILKGNYGSEATRGNFSSGGEINEGEETTLSEAIIAALKEDVERLKDDPVGMAKEFGEKFLETFEIEGEEGAFNQLFEIVKGNLTPEMIARRKKMEDVPILGIKGGPIGKIIDFISSSSQDVADNMTEKRDPKYGGGMLSDDKDRMAYAEGKEVGTHTMPDGTEMAGSTHAEYEEELDMLPDEEMDMVPDEEMEQDHLDFIINESLDAEEEMYLMEILQADDRLSMIFDKVMDTASEFSGDGPVEVLGSEVPDSIPARLSDGEFVMTAQATDEIGSDNLQNMMDSAEEVNDDRQQVAIGGEIQDESQLDQFGKVVDEDLADEEIRRSMLSVNPRLQ